MAFPTCGLRAYSTCAIWAALVFAVCMHPAHSAAAAAPAWKPDKPIEITVPGGAGGGIDTQARAVQNILQNQHLVEVPVTVVNKSGGSASVGLNYISQRPPDGHYIAMGSTALLTNHITGKSTLSYTDVTSLAQLATESIALSVRAESEIRNGLDLLQRLRKDPSSVSVGLPSIASSNHIACALLVKSVHSDPKRLRTVIFNSSGEALAALLGGHIDLVASPALNTISHLKRGALRVIAVSAPKRLEGDLAAIPTLRELGADVVVGAYRTVLGPKGMSDDRVAYWDGVLSRMVATAEWRAFVRKNSWEPNFMTSSDSAAFLKTQYETYKAILSDLGLAGTK